MKNNSNFKVLAKEWFEKGDHDLDEAKLSVVGEFSKHFVKTRKVSEEIGRNLNKSLDLRNKARYAYNAEITLDDAKDLIKLAEEMIKLTKDLLEER